MENLFSTGTVVATIGVNELVRAGKLRIEPLLQRHLQGDWGEVSPADAKLNREAVDCQGRVMSVYPRSHDGDKKIWIITDEGHEYTTVLLPEEY
jgi:hypothetical protein